MDAVETFELPGDRRFLLVRDPDPPTPLDCDNLGTMVCKHRRYALGDSQDPSTIPANDELALKLQLYLLDHGGLTIRVDPSGFQACDPQGWDWGQVGVIYVTKARVVEEYGDLSAESIKRAREVLISEVDTYDQYLRGDVYGFVIERKCPQCEVYSHEDSCYGFYGSDVRTNGILEHLSDEYSRAVTAQLEKRR